jgi:hypothetical protein
VPRPSGRARTSARRGPDPEAVDERRARALEEPLDVRLRTAEPYPLLEVRNPMHGTLYLVMVPEFPGRSGTLCTCTDFARRGLGTCKHIEAGLRWLAEHPDAPPMRPRVPEGPRAAAAWKRVDARLAATRKDGSERRRLRQVGAALFERSPDE